MILDLGAEQRRESAQVKKGQGIFRWGIQYLKLLDNHAWFWVFSLIVVESHSEPQWKRNNAPPIEQCWLLFSQLKTHPSAFFLYDTKLKDLQSTFLLWKLSLCQISAIGCKGKTKSGWIKRINAGLPVSTQNALGWLWRGLRRNFFFFFMFSFGSENYAHAPCKWRTGILF